LQAEALANLLPDLILSFPVIHPLEARGYDMGDEAAALLFDLDRTEVRKCDLELFCIQPYGRSSDVGPS
jgi:hypothetical protein